MSERWEVRRDPSKYAVQRPWQVIRQSHGGSTAMNFETEADALAQLDEWRANGICGECGDVLEDGYMEPYKQRIHEEQLCFGCLHWTDWIASRDDSMFVASGNAYQIGDEDAPRSGFRGFAGAPVIVTFPDGKVVHSTNLWTQGKIPDHFRARLPDSAQLEWK